MLPLLLGDDDRGVAGAVVGEHPHARPMDAMKMNKLKNDSCHQDSKDTQLKASPPSLRQEKNNSDLFTTKLQL